MILSPDRKGRKRKNARGKGTIEGMKKGRRSSVLLPKICRIIPVRTASYMHSNHHTMLSTPSGSTPRSL